MIAIYKYEIDLIKPTDKINKFTVELPCVSNITGRYDTGIDFNVRRVGHQGKPNILCLWIEVDTELRMGKVDFYVHGTGHKITDHENKDYVGSVIQEPYVWHIYEGV